MALPDHYRPRCEFEVDTAMVLRSSILADLRNSQCKRKNFVLSISVLQLHVAVIMNLQNLDVMFTCSDGERIFNGLTIW